MYSFHCQKVLTELVYVFESLLADLYIYSAHSFVDIF